MPEHPSRTDFARGAEIQLVGTCKDVLLPPPPQVLSSNICEFTCFYKISIDTNSLLTLKWDWTDLCQYLGPTDHKKCKQMSISVQNNILVYNSQIYLMSFGYLMLVFWFLSFQTFSFKG